MDKEYIAVIAIVIAMAMCMAAFYVSQERSYRIAPPTEGSSKKKITKKWR
jgi:hypothetical protein